MSKIKLIAIDIDGTLVNSKKQLTNKTKQIISKARKQGIKVVLCTGRPLSGAHEYLDELNISGPDEYAITFNGAMAQSTDGQVINHFTLSYDDFLETELLSRKLGVNFQFETTDSIYALNKNISRYTIYEANLVRLPIKYRTPEEISRNLTITKSMFIAEPNKIDKIKEQIPKEVYDKLYIVQTEPVFLEAMNPQASKGKTLGKLANELNLKPENVMALGDQGNDVSLMNYAGLGVAMGNAIDDVKKASKVVTKTNDEDGVAYAIQKYALK